MSLLDLKGNVSAESQQFRDIAKVCKDLFNWTHSELLAGHIWGVVQ